MPASTICFPAIIPPSGFRWIYLEKIGQWRLCDPPDDWPEGDYKAATRYEGIPGSKLTYRFHLAASIREFHSVRRTSQYGLGQMISEPDLYLKIASTRPTPSAILGLVNTYGFLRYSPSEGVVTERLAISRRNAPDIAAAFLDQPSDGDNVHLFIESAEKWLWMHDTINRNLRYWEIAQASGDLGRIDSELEDYNSLMGGSLTYQAQMDRSTGQPYSTLIATSLAGMLEVQWGMSLVASTAHRQCKECPTWIAIAPESARPEKIYCSDACRMRGYRKRKAQGSRRRTRKKSQRTP